MGDSYQIDARLLAQSYDPGKTGYVSLRNNDPALGKPGAKVSDSALAKALSRDQVVISQGAIQARKPGTPPTLPFMDSVTLANAWCDQIDAHVTSTTDGEYYPAVDYKPGPNGGTASFDWKKAFASRRATVARIDAAAARCHDPLNVAMHQKLQAALRKDTYQPGLTDDQYAVAYGDLFDTTAAFVGTAPQTPADAVASEVKDVHYADQSIQGIRKILADPRLKTITARANQVIAQLQQQVDAGATGSYVYHDDPRNIITQIRDGLATLQTAGATADTLEGQLEPVAQTAYGVIQSSWTAKSLSDVNRLSQNANAAGEAAGKIAGTSDAVQSSLNTLLGDCYPSG